MIKILTLVAASVACAGLALAQNSGGRVCTGNAAFGKHTQSWVAKAGGVYYQLKQTAKFKCTRNGMSTKACDFCWRITFSKGWQPTYPESKSVTVNCGVLEDVITRTGMSAYPPEKGVYYRCQSAIYQGLCDKVNHMPYVIHTFEFKGGQPF